MKPNLEQAKRLISECLRNLSSTLDLGYCGIDDLTQLPELFECQRLKKLIIAESWQELDQSELNAFSSNNKGIANRIKQIPPEIGKLANLEELIFTGGPDGGLTDLDFLVNLPALRILLLINNRITNFDALLNLPRLEVLDISHNEINDLPSFGQLDTLLTLDISGNPISDLNFIRTNKSLKNLQARGNRIENIEPLSGLTQLQILAVRANNVIDISPLKGLTGLRDLDIRRNQISDIQALESLKELRALYLSFNDISDISSLAGLFRLKVAYLSSNKISNIRPLKDLDLLVDLDLGINLISDLSPLKDLRKLHDLHLSSNRISDLEPLSELVNLVKLFLSSNEISNVAPIDSLKKLEILDISSNLISDIASIKDLKQLQRLDIQNNDLLDIVAIAKHPALKRLDLSENKIEDVSALARLTELVELYLSSNRVSDISHLEGLKKLRNLIVRNNQIQRIGLQLFKNKMEAKLDANTMDGFCIYGNPVESPPLEIIKQGKKSITNWFSASKEQLNEIKVVIVGEARVGKTSLLRRLRDDTFFPDEPQTEGINIEHIEFKRSETFRNQPLLHGITGHFWDFGGQEIFNATHQFFLSNRCVYLLVLQAGIDTTLPRQIERWVNRIRSKGGNSSIIVVGNQIDLSLGFGFLNESTFLRTFPQIKCFVKTSCKTGEGINELKQRLEEFIPRAELFNTTIDKKWIALKSELQKLTKRKFFLDEDSFTKICESHHITKKNEQLDAINFLHDLGILLHFHELKLARYFVLDPYWITYGVYKIITSQEVALFKGVVGMDRLDYILNHEPDKAASENKFKPRNAKKIRYNFGQQDFILQLLIRFKLCFILPDDLGFIVPNLLETEEPNYLTNPIRDREECLQFSYEYKYLPRTVLPNIMADTHQLITSKWRTGCILERKGSKALVSTFLDTLTIQVSGDGAEKIEFMAIIRYLVETINDKLTEKPIESIPLPGISASANFKDISILKDRGEDIFIYDQKRFSVADLLKGFIATNQMQMHDIARILADIASTERRVLHTVAEQKDILQVMLNRHTIYLAELIKNEHRETMINQAQIFHAIEQINSDQKNQMVGEMMELIGGILDRCKVELQENYDRQFKEFEKIYNDMKKTDDVEVKLGLSVPLLNLLGINIEAKFDLKAWAEARFKKIKEKFRIGPKKDND